MDRNNAKLRIGGTNYMAPDGIYYRLENFLKVLKNEK